MSEQILIEGCVNSVVSAIAAERGGASRVRAVQQFARGWRHSQRRRYSVDAVQNLRGAACDDPTRGRRLSYSLEELETRRGDIMVARKLGADGVVLGILDAHGKVDIALSRELVEPARPLNVTCHRAFDMSADLLSFAGIHLRNWSR